ncbi:MAG: DNA polymerase IV, partial [Desulfofustis sp.]|nr:DNA polymerase IV [Desulfofustis sp.]
MNRERAIIHLNVADFAVAVERVVDRSLCRSPVVVAPPAAARSVVYDMSDEAYEDGVRKNMPLRQAQRLCRRARILPPRPDLYRRALTDLVA